jgi:hypothetical protein
MIFFIAMLIVIILYNIMNIVMNINLSNNNYNILCIL